jgi:class 3 adenylate cyclase
MEIDLENAGLTELIRLQNQLAEAVQRRFERSLALVFTDVVGSTEYFARFGDQQGRRLQQQHLDLLNAVLPAFGGRIVDTAGDGAFTCFATAIAATDAMVALQRSITADNVNRTRDHQLLLRIGIHFGNVLADATLVSGDAVNLCARVTSTCAPGEVRLTRAAFSELPGPGRARCQPIAPPLRLKGLVEPVEVVSLQWRPPGIYPTFVRIVETAEELPLPGRDSIGFGRLAEKDGIVANDIVLWHPDKALAQTVSRWHFELRRQPSGFLLHQLSDGITEVDGQVVPQGAKVQVGTGTVVRVARVLTLELCSNERVAADLTLGPAPST